MKVEVTKSDNSTTIVITEDPRPLDNLEELRRRALDLEAALERTEYYRLPDLAHLVLDLLNYTRTKQ